MGDRVAAGGDSDDGQRADDTGNGDDDDGTAGEGAAGVTPRLTEKQKKALRQKAQQRALQVASNKDAKAKGKTIRNEHREVTLLFNPD